MELWECQCGWKYVLSPTTSQIYGPIVRMGIGEFPEALMNVQRVMSWDDWREEYADCAARFDRE
jgi:hypothetical protein